MAQNADLSRFGPAHGDAADAHVPHHHVNYYLIFGILVVLTVVTVAVAFIHFDSEWITVAIALAIASVKAFFVAWFFMHLKFEGKLIFLVVAAPLTLTVILVCALIPDIVMPGLNDEMLSRPPVPAGH